MTANEDDLKLKIFDSCPHCGHELSPWEKVLLSIDRALMCKNCWYRIILNQEDMSENQNKKNPKKKG
ncbi:MAG TPA: hypothetical protein VIK14_07485 [Ignavibacteria bacterium]|jgi:DNA-directed RNA polymerase subunit RPC12/RpoP